MATFARIRSKLALLIMLCLIALLALPFAAADDDDDMDDMDDMMEDAAFVSIRQYDGVNPDDVPRIMSVTGEGFLPIINQVEGFIGYFLMSQADMVAAVTIFDTAENATASNAAAREFVAENLTGLLPNAPIINEGVVSIWHMTPLADTDADMEHESDDDAAGHDEDSTMSDVVGELHGGLRVYAGFDVANAAQATEITESGFLPIQQEAEGFFGYLAMYNEDGVLGALSLFDNADNAAAIKDDAAAFVAEYLTDYLPDAPASMNGPVGVAGLAGVNESANLIGAAMDDDSE